MAVQGRLAMRDLYAGTVFQSKDYVVPHLVTAQEYADGRRPSHEVETNTKRKIC
jgi:hypothetical protein